VVPASDGINHKGELMYSMIADPKLATQIARQEVDERIRDAEARRPAREVRRAARAHRTANRDPRRPIRASATTTRTPTSEGT
jgi:hypothetical protein